MNGSYAYKGYPQRPYPQNNGDNITNMSGDAMASFMADGQSLDDMVLQNEKENRRQSMPVFGDAQMQMGSPDSRRLSMMAFGDSTAMDNFQFDGTMENLMRNGPFTRTTGEIQNDRMAPADLAINTQFTNANSPFTNIPAYASPMHPNANLDMEMTSPYPNMNMPLDETLMMGPNDMNMFPNAQYNTSMMNSPAAPPASQDFTGLTSAQPQDSKMNMPPPDQYRSHSSSLTPDARPKPSPRDSSQDPGSVHSSSRPQSEHQSSSNSVPTRMANASLKNQEPIALPTGQQLDPENFSDLKFPWEVPQGGFPSSKNHNPHMKTQFKNAYSSTGFDMMAVLVRCSIGLGIVRLTNHCA